MKYPVKKQFGFTLLEVLMVVAMLAIVGGAIITNYGGLTDKAATGTSVHSMQAVKNAFNVFASTEGALPSNLDSLIAGTPTTPTAEAPDTHATDVTNEEFLDIISPALAARLEIVDVNPEVLVEAGIVEVRYVDLKGNAEDDGPHTLDIFAPDGTTKAQVGSIDEIEIPGDAFEMPEADGNNGRGFHVSLAADTPVPMARWIAGTNGVNNINVGGEATSQLIAFGLGDLCTLIGHGTFTNLADAPFHGAAGKGRYNRYIVLIDVNADPARFVSVLCPSGDETDAEFSGFQGGSGHSH